MRKNRIPKAFGILALTWLLIGLPGCASPTPAPTPIPEITPTTVVDEETSLVPPDLADFVMPQLPAAPGAYPAAFSELDFMAGTAESPAFISGMDKEEIARFYLAQLSCQGVISARSFEETADFDLLSVNRV